MMVLNYNVEFLQTRSEVLNSVQYLLFRRGKRSCARSGSSSSPGPGRYMALGFGSSSWREARNGSTLSSIGTRSKQTSCDTIWRVGNVANRGTQVLTRTWDQDKTSCGLVTVARLQCLGLEHAYSIFHWAPKYREAPWAGQGGTNE